MKGNEQLFVYSGFALAFIVMLIFIFVVYTNIISKIQLEQKFDSEKSFNSVYMALSDSTEKALITMKEERVRGVGIYNISGKVFVSLGEAPVTLPINKLMQARQGGQDSTLGMFIYNKEKKEIEYFRLSRLNVLLELGEKDFASGILSASSDYPEILYIRYNGENYFKSLFKARVLTVVGVIALFLVFAYAANIYHKNRKYRQEILKNQNLAQLGSAARTLTHEIKNPLSAMKIQSALMKKTLPDEFQQDLDVMEHEIERLTTLTNRVSEFLKNPLGNPEKIELVSFVTEIGKLFQQQISFEFHQKEKIFTRFDRDRARSVIENLIKNATESTTERDPQVLIDVNLIKKKFVRIRVLDRGDGLSDEVKNKIYDPFPTHSSSIKIFRYQTFITTCHS